MLVRFCSAPLPARAPAPPEGTRVGDGEARRLRSRRMRLHGSSSFHERVKSGQAPKMGAEGCSYERWIARKGFRRQREGQVEPREGPYEGVGI